MVYVHSWTRNSDLFCRSSLHGTLWIYLGSVIIQAPYYLCIRILFHVFQIRLLAFVDVGLITAGYLPRSDVSFRDVSFPASVVLERRSVGLGDLINVDWPIPLVIKFYPIGQLGDSCQIGFKTKALTKQDGVWVLRTKWDWTLSITLFSSLSFISMLNLAVVGSPGPLFPTYVSYGRAQNYTPIETLVRGRVV
jgi:hypothetical protein